MMISLPLGALTLAVCLAMSAQAQSTTRVGQREKPVRLELSAGYDHSGSGYAHGDPGTVVTGTAAIRWLPSATWVGVRGAVSGIRRRSHYVSPYSSGDATDREDRILTLTISTDASFRIWRDLIIGPSGGVGFAPYAHGERTVTHSPGTSGTPPAPVEHYSRAETGTIWTAGVALRYRHLVIEKQVIGLLGARGAVTENREYYPLSVGFRF